MSAFSWLSLRFCRWGWSRVVGPAGEVPACWRGSTLLVQPAVAFGRVSLIGCPSLERDPFTLNKSECSKQALRRSNGSAWNNRRGPASASVGLTEAGNDQEGRTGAEVWLGERWISLTRGGTPESDGILTDVYSGRGLKRRIRTGLDTRFTPADFAGIGVCVWEEGGRSNGVWPLGETSTGINFFPHPGWPI